MKDQPQKIFRSLSRSIFSLKRSEFQTIRPVVWWKNTAFPLASAGLRRRLAVKTLKNKNAGAFARPGAVVCQKKDAYGFMPILSTACMPPSEFTTSVMP